jgi:hypothetical protein
MQRHSWWEVAGGTWQGTQVGYTSFLRGRSRKAATAHFHVENHVKIDILWAAAEHAHNLTWRKMCGELQSKQMEFGTLNKFWKFSNKIAGNEVSFFLEE